MANVKDILNKEIRDMKVSDLYTFGLENSSTIGTENQKDTTKTFEQLSVDFVRSRADLLTAKSDIISTSKTMSLLTKDLQENQTNLQQSRVEVAQSRLDNQQTRVELINFKNESKIVIENLNNRLDELLKMNQQSTASFYQNIVNHLDEHFNSDSFPEKRRKLNSTDIGEVDASESESEVDVNTAESNNNDDELDEEDVDVDAELSGDQEETGHEPSGGAAKKEPMYRLIRNTDSIPEIWEEYVRGVHGGPAVKELEAKYASKWRDDKERSILAHRRKVYAMIEKAIANGWEEEKAVEFLEKHLLNEYGEKRSFAWLFENPPEGFK